MEQYDDGYYYYDYLAHHGIKGMRWGIRRFQRKDGSLTPQGQKRRTLRDVIHDRKVNKKRKAALEKARAAKQANKEAEEKEQKKAEKRMKALEKGRLPVSKMTDAELQYSIARKKAEDQYNQLQLETSVTKRFLDNAWNNAIEPALITAGRNVLTDFVDKKASDLLGLNEKKSVVQLLKDQHDIAKYKKEIAEFNAQEKKIKEGKSTDDEDFEKLEREAKKAKYLKEIDDYNRSKRDTSDIDDLKREAERTNYEKQIAENTAQAKKAREGETAQEAEMRALKTEAERTGYMKNIAVNKDVISKKTAEAGKEAANNVKKDMSKTKVDDVKSNNQTKAAKDWVQTDSGIWLSNTTYNSLKK